MFVEGPLSGRLRVHGTYIAGPRESARLTGTAVYAIPRRAVLYRKGSLWLNVPASRAQYKWLMHIVPSKKA